MARLAAPPIDERLRLMLRSVLAKKSLDNDALWREEILPLINNFLEALGQLVRQSVTTNANAPAAHITDNINRTLSAISRTLANSFADSAPFTVHRLAELFVSYNESGYSLSTVALAQKWLVALARVLSVSSSESMFAERQTFAAPALSTSSSTSGRSLDVLEDEREKYKLPPNIRFERLDWGKELSTNGQAHGKADHEMNGKAGCEVNGRANGETSGEINSERAVQVKETFNGRLDSEKNGTPRSDLKSELDLPLPKRVKSAEGPEEQHTKNDVSERSPTQKSQTLHKTESREALLPLSATSHQDSEAVLSKTHDELIESSENILQAAVSTEELTESKQRVTFIPSPARSHADQIEERNSDCSQTAFYESSSVDQDEQKMRAEEVLI